MSNVINQNTPSILEYPRWVWTHTYAALGNHESATSLSLTCKAGLEYLAYLPQSNLNSKKRFGIHQWVEPLNSTRVKIYTNYRGVFLNHPDDDTATGTFIRTMFETFLPGRGAYETRTVPHNVQNQIYQPSLCPAPNGKSSHLTILWGGHATFLLEYKYSNTMPPIKIVIDPNNSNEIPLVAGSRYPRMIPAGIPKEMIQDIDLGLVTHNHSDHCDEQMIQMMSQNKNFHLLGPEKTPNRLAKKFGCVGLEHKWWDQTTIFYCDLDIIHITALPAHHSSAGREVKTQEEGWCGWKLAFRTQENSWYTIYCMGDTACHNDLNIQGTNSQHNKHHVKMFNEIKEELGHVNLALVPIDPPTGEESTHLNIYQSANLFAEHITDVDSILPMHYGTWCWGAGCNPDKILEPRRLFDQIMEDRGLDNKLFFIQVGQSITLF